MHVKRFEEAQPYEAPNHRGVVGLRLQGFEEGGPENQWIGLSQFLPGGGAGPDSTPFEKVYVVLDGEMTVETGGTTTVLKNLTVARSRQVKCARSKTAQTMSARCLSSFPIRRRQSDG